MYLEGQDSQRGFAMAALLVSVGVMMLLMSVAMPVWRHEMQREKEAELVFRGEQYARAINLYQRKMGPGNFPPNIDILVQQRFLRKKYKDPITNGDFQLISVGAGVPTVPGQQQQQPGGGQQGGGRGRGPSTGPYQPSQDGGRGSAAQQPARGFGGGGLGGGQIGEGGQVAGGIMGVASKSKESAIRLYHGATHYNEWAFLFSNVSNRPGTPGGGRGAPQNPGGQRGSGRGNRGNPGSLNAPGMPPGGLGAPGGARGVRPGGTGPRRESQD
jgi:type II secretory pathway pseudopilin PulG